MLTSLKKRIDQTFTYFPTTTKTATILHPYFYNNIGESVHNSPASKEWFNSIYSYNKNFAKTLPSTDKLVNKLIKSYFSLDKLKNNKRSKRIIVRFKRLSLNRTLVSRAEINHTSNKAIIYIYVYNRNKKIYLHKLKKLYKTLIFKKNSTLKKILSINKEENKPVENLVTNYSNVKHIPIKKNNKVNNNSPTSENIRKIRVFSSRRFKNSSITRKIRKSYCRLLSDLKIRSISKLLSKLHTVSSKSKSLIKKHYFLKYLPKALSSNDTSENYFVYFINWPKNSLNVIGNKKALSLPESSNLHKISNKNLFFTTKISKKRDFRSYKNIFTKDALKSVKISNKQFLLYRLRNLHRLILANYKLNNKSVLPFPTGPGIGENVYLKNLVGRNTPIQDTRISKKSNSSFHNTKLNKKVNFITLKSLKILRKVRKHKRFLLKILKWNKINFRLYENRYYNDYLNKSYKKEMLYLYYVRILSLNNNKFKSWFITGLKSIISRVYKKKVVFNIVNLKYLHLNSDVFSESISIKLKNRKNRLLRVLKKALKLAKLPMLQQYSIYSTGNNENNKFYTNKYYEHTLNKNNIEKTVLDNIKYKTINGVRLEAAGRLSKRLTASRSVFKFKYKGNLKNRDSSYNKLSSVMLRGHIKPNLQYTNISSKTRNGSFGLKGWVSSY